MRFRWFGVLVYTGLLVLAMQLYIICFGRGSAVEGWVSGVLDRKALWRFYEERAECSCSCHCDNVTSPLLTLFTSIKDLKVRRAIHNRTLINWASLGPAVRPVLYVTGDEEYDWGVAAKALGWSVRYAPKLVKGIPVLKDLFRDVRQSSVQTPFYGFANSDNMFDTSLVDTLRYLYVTVDPSNVFVVGRRTNVNVKDIDNNYVKDPKYVASLMPRGTLFKTNAQDYFITTSGGFPWDKVPDFVIGRPGYDNWLVAKSLDWRVNIIDATETIHDIHQTGSDGNMSGWNSTDDLCVNRNMVGEFDYHPGHTMCVPWYTARTISGGVAAVKRTSIPTECAKRPVKRREGQPCI